MTLPASFTADSSLPALFRGVPLSFVVGTVPSVEGLFDGKVVTCYLDSSDTGERITITETVGTGTGTWEETGIVVSADGSEVTVNLEDTEQLEDGAVYKVILVLETTGGPKESIGPWDLPVRTMPGGLV